MSKIIENQRKKVTSILNAATELFISKSFANTTIDDVVKKAGIAKGTFYLYFKDKYDLMDRLMAKKGIDVLKNAFSELENEEVAESLSFSERMIFIVKQITDYLKKHRELVSLVEKNLSKCLTRIETDDDPAFKTGLHSLLSCAAEEGIPEDDALKKIYLTVDLVGSVMSDALLFSSPYSVDEIEPLLYTSVSRILQ